MCAAYTASCSNQERFHWPLLKHILNETYKHVYKHFRSENDKYIEFQAFYDAGHQNYNYGEHEDNGVGDANHDGYCTSLGTVWRYWLDRADRLRKSLYLSGVKPLLLAVLVNSVLCSEPLLEVVWSQKLGRSKFFDRGGGSKAAAGECGGTRLHVLFPYSMYILISYIAPKK